LWLEAAMESCKTALGRLIIRAFGQHFVPLRFGFRESAGGREDQGEIVTGLKPAFAPL
jgi:hypothetical protein